MTTVGVAHRGRIPLTNISAQLQVQRVDSGMPRFGVKETMIFGGSFDQQQLSKLERTVEFCPRGQEFTKQVMQFEDHIEFEHGPASAERKEMISSPPDVNQALVPGSVEAHYLPGTAEALDAVFNEGETKVYFSCDTKIRANRWSTLAGHTSGWCPLPVHLTNGGLAASLVSTICQMVSPIEFSPADLEVVVQAPGRAGGKAAVQAAAEGGTLRKQVLIRTLFLRGPLRDLPMDTIRQALKNDPLCRYYADGNILLGKEIVVTATTAKA